MDWYEIINQQGEVIKLVFVTNLEDLISNVPEGYTVRAKPPETVEL
jgi:hypothetical protein